MNITKDKLAHLIKEAQKAHHVYEESIGKKDEDWASWYAEFIIEKLKRDDTTEKL